MKKSAKTGIKIPKKKRLEIYKYVLETRDKIIGNLPPELGGLIIAHNVRQMAGKYYNSMDEHATEINLTNPLLDPKELIKNRESNRIESDLEANIALELMILLAQE